MEQVSRLIAMASRMDIGLDIHEATLLVEYMNGILDINKNLNLTRITDPDEFFRKHILDSLTLLKLMSDQVNILDVGTGGGFPGVPLAICRRHSTVTLLDATAKKIKAVDELCKKLGISNVKCITGRAEELSGQKEFREKYEMVCSRAVANMRVLAELCLPFVKRKGTFFALKGQNYKVELKEAKEAIGILGGRISKIHTQNLLQSDRVHVIIAISKMNKTPKKYPRPYSQILNKPR